MVIEALFVIAKKNENNPHVHSGEWINKMWYTRATECSVIKRKEVMIHTTNQ